MTELDDERDRRDLDEPDRGHLGCGDSEPGGQQRGLPRAPPGRGGRRAPAAASTAAGRQRDEGGAGQDQAAGDEKGVGGPSERYGRGHQGRAGDEQQFRGDRVQAERARRSRSAVRRAVIVARRAEVSGGVLIPAMATAIQDTAGDGATARSARLAAAPTAPAPARTRLPAGPPAAR